MALIAGDQRIVSVLAADVVGSTTIGERLGPERSKFLFDEIVGHMASSVRRYDGTVAQLLGDGLIALFGAPVAHEDDAKRAVRAALLMQRRIGRYARDVEAAYGITVGARVAINTGPVIVPAGEDLDVAERYNALGDTVNVAARLQAEGIEGSVVVAGETARQVEETFALESLGELELRGRQDAVEAFRVTGDRSPTDQRDPAVPLVGRDFDVAALEHSVDSLAEGRGVILSITGEPGIGKSRLAAELRRRAGDRICFLEGRASAYGESTPYWPIRDLLRGWLGVGFDTPEAQVRLELRAELAHLAGPDAPRQYTLLAGLLGLPPEPGTDDSVRDLSRESLQRQTFSAVADLLEVLAADRPTCIVLDDLQWADSATLELVEELMAVTDQGAVGLILVYRSERDRGAWRLGERARQLYPHRFREIELRPLAPDASRLLVDTLAGGEVPTSVADALTDRAGGNPFFLEEALRDLVERGALRRANGHWERAVETHDLAVPTLVQGALQARLDRLAPTTRSVVSVAAVIGRRFGLHLLEKSAATAELPAALSELQRLDLVVEVRRRPSPEYRFRHGLVQEVAYASLLEPSRRELHRRVGEALEDLSRDAPEEVYGILAHHFAEADDPRRASHYLLAAGDQARAAYADHEAIAYYTRARRFQARLGDDVAARSTLFKIALTHHLAFEFEAAEDAYDAAFLCRVEDHSGPPPAAHMTAALGQPQAVTPGVAYTTDAGTVIEQLFRGLLRVDRDLNVVPEMASNMRVSADGLTYLFMLREGARWSDGEPVTMHDFVYSWDRLREEGGELAFLLEDVESAEALDDWTLEVRLREPRNYFPYVLASHWAYPWPKHVCEQHGADWRRPPNVVCNGPFMITGMDDDGATLVVNPHWTGPRGNVGTIDLRFYPPGPEPTAAADWKAGLLDFRVADTQDDAFDAPDTVLESPPLLVTQYIGFNATVPPFDHELVRRAFAHATDVQAIVDRVAPTSRPALRGGPMPPAMPGHTDGIAPGVDLERAKQLLADAGYPGGEGLPEIRVATAAWFRESGLEEQWAALGARVTVEISATGHSCSPPEARSAHAWVAGWTADYPDPDGFYRGLFASANWPFHMDEEIVGLLAEARASRDRDERLRAFRELERLWAGERAAMVAISYSRSLLLRRPWLHGVSANPMAGLHLEEVVIERPDSSPSPPDVGDAIP
jgi:ABC-type transport system substrate-binding protein/class 3 adenylate cyclase